MPSTLAHSDALPPTGVGAGDRATKRLADLVVLPSAALALTTLLIGPGTFRDHLFAGAIVAVCGMIAAIATRLAGPRRQVAVLEGSTLLGHAVVAGVIVLSGDPTSPYALFYLWPLVNSAYVLPDRRVVMQVALAAGTYAGALSILGGLPEQTPRFLLTVATLAVVGGLTAVLRRQVGALLTEAARNARSDAVTGLLNRQGLEERLALELARGRRDGSPVAVLVSDLDEFTVVNERLGHAGGDLVLARVATVIAASVRSIDAVARLHGESFVAVLPGTDAQGAANVAERVRAAVAESYGGQVTLSIGVAAAPGDGAEPDRLLRAGEEALAAAKALGRDRVWVFGPDVAGILARARTLRGAQGDMQLATVLTLAEALDLRDAGTARHSETVSRYAEAMARELGLPSAEVERVRLAGVLHDVGKIGVRDNVLMKPGKLTDEELAEMRRHPEIGARLLTTPALDDIREWVLCHHERPDGRGYPRRLAGAEIPLEARILAVADAYEAMTARRVYKEPMAHDDARAELVRCAGAQFDEDVVAVFLRLPDYEVASVEPQWVA